MSRPTTLGWQRNVAMLSLPLRLGQCTCVAAGWHRPRAQGRVSHAKVSCVHCIDQREWQIEQALSHSEHAQPEASCGTACTLSSAGDDLPRHPVFSWTMEVNELWM